MNIPNRSIWIRIKARPGTYFMDRDRWCRDNCQGRWIQKESLVEFESQRDAVAFALKWG